MSFDGSPLIFLNGVSIGTMVTIQFDGGGVAGVWRGRFQGFDGRGNALFTRLTSFTTGRVLPGITRIPIHRINAVSV
ncbi:hypothetical protein SD70_15625 [Gordoniibacillus kamchatkensis]|uniref:Uncharacterized protein n=1 Tax=Gordoniibacillus kamchatkensis TaxID=1590651 RepID=A0ABR5AGC8_9BACL|nr:hypothetical protein [Paenibacillus sp. VKM B-2647]KIL40108.1 hypothetical protein SD70_15625 [Paenibacillus sp. VKM B-2647]